MGKEKHHEYSEPVQEIMGTIPSWTIRWGTTVIATMFTIIMLGCCIIKYPETVSSTITLICSNPPSHLVARYAGIIDTITVNNGQSVKQGEMIALLKTPAVYEDILAVKSFADSVRFSQLEDIADDIILKKKLDLGSLQDYWTELVNLATEYQFFCNLDQIGKKRNMLLERIKKYKEYYNAMHGQRDLLEKDTRLQMLSMQRDSVLWSEGMSALAEYEASQQAYLSKLNSLVSFDAGFESAILNNMTLEQELLDLNLQRRAEEDRFNLSYSRIITELISQIASWIEMYAIIAPFDGVVSLQDFWGVGQHVSVGDILASVVPITGTIIKGRMKVNTMGIGKIAKGQIVNIRLNGFPYIKYGILKGRISWISQVPEKTLDGSVAYNVEVSFPNGLTSTYRKTLPFIQDMDGEAEIITRDQRLIEVFIQPIVSLFKNK